MKHRFRPLIITILIFAGLLLHQPVSAGNHITVDTTNPAIASDGACSLYEAVINANNNAGTHPDCLPGNGNDVIQLPPDSTITLTTAHQADTGLPHISDHLTIEGNGATVTRDLSAARFRIVRTSGGNLTLNNITISRGAAPHGGDNTGCANASKGEDGGGIYVGASDSLTLNNSYIFDNSAGAGGLVMSFGEGMAGVGVVFLSAMALVGQPSP